LAAVAGKPLLVLGMHRSGTSSFVGVAARLGAALGDDLLAADQWNPRGYGEHRGVVEIHDRFLAAQGLRWDSARRPAHFTGPAADEARASLAALLEREFASDPLFAVKDPRLCRLLPLWKPVLEALPQPPACVIVLRHPLEIAASLARRDGIERSRSHLLVTEHLLPVERETRDLARSVVLYEDITADWRGVAKRVAVDCGLRWPRDPEAAAFDVEAFLSAELRHHRSAEWPAEEAARFPAVVALHRELTALALRGPSAERAAAIDRIAADLAAAAHLYEPELAALEGHVAMLAGQCEQIEKEARKAERKRDALADAPLLWLRTFLRRRLRGGPV
jgi:hypothetical protein